MSLRIPYDGIEKVITIFNNSPTILTSKDVYTLVFVNLTGSKTMIVEDESDYTTTYLRFTLNSGITLLDEGWHSYSLYNSDTILIKTGRVYVYGSEDSAGNSPNDTEYIEETTKYVYKK
jgi:hypothetical protein